MSDIIDDANDTAQADLDRRIAAARRATTAPVEPLPEHCANGCGEKARERSRWCSSECRDEEAFRVRQLARLGRR